MIFMTFREEKFFYLIFTMLEDHKRKFLSVYNGISSFALSVALKSDWIVKVTSVVYGLCGEEIRLVSRR